MRRASTQAARGALGQALELVVQERDRLRVSAAGDENLQGLLEQRASLQLLEQVSRLAGGHVLAKMGLRELLCHPLQFICELLMQASWWRGGRGMAHLGGRAILEGPEHQGYL